MTAPEVLLLENVHDDADEAFDRAGLSMARHDGALADDELIEALCGVRVLGIRSKTQISGDVIQACPGLEAIGCFCIGTNQVDLDAASACGLSVFNSPFSNTRSVAEMTLAEIISLHRGLFDRSTAAHAGMWRKSARGSHEVRGRTLGIVGYGHIGSQISVLAEALGMRVVYYDVAPRMAMGNAEPCDTLAEVLEQSDVVTLHVPDTPSTRGLIGQGELDRMRPGACLINNARGSVVDLDALRAALASGYIGGAAVDVYPTEPTSSGDAFECPLAGMPNVILTPHVGGSTEEAQASIARDVGHKLVRFVQTGTTTSSVNIPEVDLPGHHPEHMRLLHFHRNVPGVLSSLHAIIAEAGVNIHAEYLQSQGLLSYVILDIDHTDQPRLRQHIESLDETIRLRMLG